MGNFLFACVLAMLATATATAQQKLKLITYNVYEGMRMDSTAGKSAFAAWIKQQDPDILALQELTGFTQTSLEQFARQYGHPYAVLLVEGEKFPVGITSRYPITAVQKVSDNMDRGFIIARVLNYNVVSLHFTPFDYRKRREEVDLLLAHMGADIDSKRWVVMGDFNTLSPEDSLAYSDGRMVANYLAYEKKYAPILKLANGRIDYSVIQKIRNNGLQDAIKRKYRSFVKTVHPKRFEPKSGTEVPSRIDFIFLSEVLIHQLTAASVISDAFTNNYSDHYPVMITLQHK